MITPFPVRRSLAYVVLLLLSIGCSSSEKEADEPVLFTAMTPEKTHVTFQNNLEEGLNTNVLMYEYFYNGGGVAVGDLNSDGLDDLYFSANMTANQLYLNRGDFRFDDVTKAAGVAGREGPWKTGVSMADVNADGKLDLFVCYSGKLSGSKRTNQLFINQGNDAKGIPQFADETQAFGLADSTHTTQAVFFDYDHDSDLDLLLINHNPKRLTLYPAGTAELASKPDTQIGLRLLAQETGPGGQPRFRDVTKEAGLHSSVLSYGLSAGVADLNGDTWPDIYVSNDYSVPDYLYINRGTAKIPGFTDELGQSMGHTSQFSMGNSVVDVNNDGSPDVFTLDMLPADNHRQKMLFMPDNYTAFDLVLNAGFHHQYMRNMLHLNMGRGQTAVGKGKPASTSYAPLFSEVGQLAGLSNTDWSWAPLFADYDNDGWKDLFVTNGYTRDYTNMDFLKYMSDELQRNEGNVRRQTLLDIVQKMPSSGVVNYLFRNRGGSGTLAFTDVGRAWGMTQPSNSNGAAYADLDNDGDLDLVVNNINQPAFIYRNEASTQTKNHFLALKLAGSGRNTQGLGAAITIYSRGNQQYIEQMPSRGYQSSVSPVLHFGLGATDVIDSLRIVWPDGQQQRLVNVKANRTLTLRQAQADTPYASHKPDAALFIEVPSPIAYQPAKSTVNDFRRQTLLINPLSFSGPCMTSADVNRDGLPDVYVGGDNGQPGALYLGKVGGQFEQKNVPAFAADKASTDADALFFDANGDGFADLYVASGGYANYQPDDPLLQDRLYLNDGRGNFARSPDALPAMRTSTGCVRVADLNGDGKPDLFVGGRVVPGRYPEPPASYLLLNAGAGKFHNATAQLGPALQRIGMVTDAAFVDLTGDKQPELVIVGEWMPVTVFSQKAGKWTDNTRSFFSKDYRGWWNKLIVGDFNRDGNPDLIVGNMGLNTQCRASDSQPAELVYKDFDNNGTVDPILCLYMQGKSYPYVSRDELLEQISSMRARFPDYKSYADGTLTSIFTPDELKGASRLTANFLKTAYFQSTPSRKFREVPLPEEAQFSPVFALAAPDYNRDGNPDLVLAGNVSKARLRFGKSDANYGLLLRNDGKGTFRAVPQGTSGFHLTGDVRSILPLGKTLLFGINQQPLRAYQAVN